MCYEVFEIMNSHACLCVLNNLLLTCNYDYNINNHFEKCDTTPECKQNIMNHTCPLGWLLIKCLFQNYLGIFWTEVF
jgi:hypothetical protein